MGYRDYRPDVLQRLDLLRRSRVAGLTLAQIRDVLQVRDGGTAPCHHVQQLLSTGVDTLDRQIADLQALRHTVAELRDAATSVDAAHCDATTVCRYV